MQCGKGGSVPPKAKQLPKLVVLTMHIGTSVLRILAMPSSASLTRTWAPIMRVPTLSDKYDDETVFAGSARCALLHRAFFVGGIVHARDLCQ